MKKTKQTFNDGDVIFREGGPSDTAYEIVSGTVEIAKMGDGGNVLLATLGAGQMFGEMGVLDLEKRNATAKAVGPLTVNAIDRKDFLAGAGCDGGQVGFKARKKGAKNPLGTPI